MELLSHKTNYKGLFADKRLEKRASMIVQSLLHSRTVSVHGATRDEAEQKGFYRFLENKSPKPNPTIQNNASDVKKKPCKQ